MRKTDEALRTLRLALNDGEQARWPDDLALVSKDAIRDLIDEVLELRDYVCTRHECSVCKAALLPSSVKPRCQDCDEPEDS